MRNRCRLYVVLSLFWMFLTSETVKFSHLTIKDGLSQSNVKCLFQDSKGYLWIGTADGLNRFDGYQFTIFNNSPIDNFSIGSNDISCIYENPNDSTLWIGTQNSGLNIYNRNLNNFIAFTRNSKNEKSLPSNRINDLLVGEGNILIIATQTAGICYFHPEDSTFSQPDFSKAQEFQTITCMKRDQLGNLWLGTPRGLYKWGKNTSTPIPISISKKLQNIKVTTLQFDFKNNLWIGTRNRGLFKIHPNSNSQSNYFEKFEQVSSNSKWIRTILQTLNGEIWVGTMNGLYRYNAAENDFEQYTTNPNNSDALNSNGIYSLLEDRSGILWVGTFLGGLNKMDKLQSRFQKYNNFSSENFNQLSNNSIRSIYVDKNGTTWLGTSTGLVEISKNHENNNSLGAFKKVHLKNKSIGAITSIDDNLIINVDNKISIYSFNERLNSISREIKNQTGLTVQSFSSSLTDNNKNIWFTTPSGLMKYSKNENEYKRYNPIGPDGEKMPINPIAISEDKTDKLWLGTYDGKLYTFNKYKEEFELIISGREDNDLISFDRIFSICVYGLNQIWLGTNLGLYRLNSNTLEITRFLDSDGLPNNVVYAVISDNTGKIWCSTNVGISCYDPSLNSFQNYTFEDGLQSNEFNEGAYFKDKNGNIYFGGIDGLNIFDPEKITPNNFIPPVVITNMEIQYKRIDPLLYPEVTNKQISETKKLNLTYKQNTFSFEFIALSFSLPQRNQYKYSLTEKGGEDEWVEAGIRRMAAYTNVPPGNYIFKVMGSNSDGIWNEIPSTINITIRPPFWGTIWFRGLLFLLAIGFTYLIIYLRIRRIHQQKRILKKLVKQKMETLKQQTEQIENQNKELTIVNKKIGLKNENIERINQQLNKQHSQILKQRDNLLHMAEKVEETNQSKFRFFTGISHEFRTPLTLIISPLRETLKNIDNWDRKEIAHKLNNVYSNASKLLLLVNQLLDFRKVETDNMKMLVSKFELTPFVQKNAFLFNDWAARKKIQFNFSSTSANIEVWADKDKLEKIIYNLLSNAFKFTPNNGLIDLKLSSVEKEDEKYIELRVIDNGVGIEQDKTELIFDRFFQLEKPSLDQTGGSGLGLALVKKYVELHKGTISVISAPNKGSKFIVQLPTGRKHFDKNVRFDESVGEDKEILLASIGEYIPFTNEVENSVENREKQTLLIVEDDNSLRAYLKDILSVQYNIEEAENTRMGFYIAETKNPDLVICDIMLPGSNGFELCKKLKSEFQTSHLPVILLTSLADKKNKMFGIKAGADGYITKPFDLQHLILSVENLIEGRLRLQRKFSLTDPDNIDAVVSNSKDQQFLKKAVKCIEANLTDTSFNVELFCVQMQFSQPQCYRKIKAITGFNISEFIRNTRLKEASKLLKSGEFKINEVAYETGFNDPNYFTKSFTKLFGMTPSDYTKL